MSSYASLSWHKDSSLKGAQRVALESLSIVSDKANLSLANNYNFLVVFFVTFGSLTYGYNSAIIGSVIGLQGSQLLSPMSPSLESESD